MNKIKNLEARVIQLEIEVKELRKQLQIPTDTFDREALIRERRVIFTPIDKTLYPDYCFKHIHYSKVLKAICSHLKIKFELISPQEEKIKVVKDEKKSK